MTTFERPTHARILHERSDEHFLPVESLFQLSFLSV